MTDRVTITDVSPRDGLQNEAGVVPTADKVRLIGALVAAGVDEVEAASFVSPRWVPQLGDAAEVLTALRASGVFRHGASEYDGDEQRRSPLPGGEGVGLSVLVPNERGFERAVRFHSAAFPLKIAVFTAASETFSRTNTNATIAESIERFRAFVPRAVGMGMRQRLYVSCAIACPYEGSIEPAAVRRVCDELMTLAPAEWFEDGRAELDLGDTIGAATPASVRALLGVFEESERARLVLHLHDTFGRASACVRAALDLGVRSFDGSVAGLGGCPYAGTREKPAPGNISTETLVRVVRESGFETGVDDESLAVAASVAREVVGRARAPGV